MRCQNILTIRMGFDGGFEGFDEQAMERGCLNSAVRIKVVSPDVVVTLELHVSSQV